MTFEEWWNTKDYPARCKGNCMEAFNAGLHADVHTDNSKVIAELKAQIEKMKCCENCKYKDLDYSFSPICISRGWDNIRGIGGNPLTFKCDEWEIKEND
jgi:hypothetical protein